jgi:hypothetical protein
MAKYMLLFELLFHPLPFLPFLSTSAQSGNSEVPVYFLKAKQKMYHKKNGKR